ncbi:MAG: lamin tail domain-containing protein [Actinobacteria bacterium]|nr:lamin tail domain-containing protein [Actinomycetota bacterium]
MRRTLPLLAAALMVAACTSPALSPPAAPASPPGTMGTAPALPVMPPGDPIEVIRVLDGDSLEAVVEGATEEIRLLGINTPERDECWADRARQATSDLIADGPVTATFQGTDQYGRLLGYLASGEVFVNAALVAGGHAMTVTTGHAYLEEFRTAEAAAIAASIGMWGPDACGPGLGTALRIDGVDGNPSGEDDDPDHGESVLIANHGSAAVDLGGWVLRDESSAHRYRFPAAAVLAPGATLRVYSACGIHEYCFGEGETVWSNTGDTALLLDPSGNVVDRVRFGS